ncbi:DUF350 domain-containing protein [Rhodovulum sp. DZ06]|uniref:DUF350 domain-containing protein n=1 Tax=Rhodovulum sp. DZ06 TaxID=3425126 RepID=UPI003D34074D
MDILAQVTASGLFGTVIYTVVGVGLLAACWYILDLLTPYSLHKEIEEDQNVALAIVIAGLFLSVAIIIAAVILS